MCLSILFIAYIPIIYLFIFRCVCLFIYLCIYYLFSLVCLFVSYCLFFFVPASKDGVLDVKAIMTNPILLSRHQNAERNLNVKIATKSSENVTKC
jgi:hypothetical protein